jgi:hypothetical protein
MRHRLNPSVRRGQEKKPLSAQHGAGYPEYPVDGLSRMSQDSSFRLVGFFVNKRTVRLGIVAGACSSFPPRDLAI